MRYADYYDSDIHNAYYQGYTGNVEVSNLFVFNIFREVIHTGVNFSGRKHGIKLASTSGFVYPKLGEEITPAGNYILGDSPLLSSLGVASGKIVRARKSNETKDITSYTTLVEIGLVLQLVLPRQSAE